MVEPSPLGDGEWSSVDLFFLVENISAEDRERCFLEMSVCRSQGFRSSEQRVKTVL